MAIETLNDVQTTQQIGEYFDIHQMQVTEWKKAMNAGASRVFGPDQPALNMEVYWCLGQWIDAFFDAV